MTFIQCGWKLLSVGHLWNSTSVTHFIGKPQVTRPAWATYASTRYDTPTGKLPPAGAGTGCGVAGPFGRWTGGQVSRWTGGQVSRYPGWGQVSRYTKAGPRLGVGRYQAQLLPCVTHRWVTSGREGCREGGGWRWRGGPRHRRARRRQGSVSAGGRPGRGAHTRYTRLVTCPASIGYSTRTSHNIYYCSSLHKSFF